MTQRVSNAIEVRFDSQCSLMWPPIFEDIAGLAVERFANGFERREAHGFGFAVFEYGKISHGNANFLGELGDAHFALGQHHIYVNDYCHG